jgi:hypothetical protein
MSRRFNVLFISIFPWFLSLDVSVTPTEQIKCSGTERGWRVYSSFPRAAGPPPPEAAECVCLWLLALAKNSARWGCVQYTTSLKYLAWVQLVGTSIRQYTTPGQRAALALQLVGLGTGLTEFSPEALPSFKDTFLKLHSEANL